MVLASQGYRLLALFRFWNVIQYFYPYRYAMDVDWDVTLAEMIPVFREAVDTMGYHLAVRRLATRLQDTHSRAMDPWYIRTVTGTRSFPAAVRYLEHRVIIADFDDDSLSKTINLRVGDIVEAVDGEA